MTRLSSIVFPIAYVACKIWLRDSLVPLDSIDFRTELDKIEAEDMECSRNDALYDNVIVE